MYVLKHYPDIDRTTLIELLKLSWDKPQREFQYFSYDIATKHLQKLIGTGNEICQQSVDELKCMLTHKKSYWDTVDSIAPGGE